ncbi:Response regulator receiver domain-containing protein [Xaviernesmea oryzae]|uniref:Response regulator receiver domain-containing protein n=1 Tax=Xaviernesmea oryzae TaxID=464029 RepID=A0A1X7CKQ1_9HYPH|nr:response regulator [Xaviernesmea oryzae]SME98330.1 Response regulator receiver domain-containing protein [Xaviernesmea oryzae]
MLTKVPRRRLPREAMNQQVLIIEDEFLIALDIAETVENMGLKVAGFANARKHALELASRADIAIVDVNLADGRTGPDIGRQLAERYGITVIFMTGNPDDIEDREKGFLGVLTKPVAPRVLEQSIDYAIADRLGTMAIVPRELKVFRQNSG